jgi:photosystem II stability/assembly factor-like uncharacterized protein
MRKLIAALAVGFVSLLFFAMGSAEQEAPEIAATNWQPIGPNGGDVRGIAFNPQNKNEIYAVIFSNPGQVYRSTNAGSNWTRIAILDDYTYDVVVDPTNPSVVYVLGDSCVFKSTDRGLTWTLHYLPYYCYAWYGQIDISPINPSILYVAGRRYYDINRNKTCMAIFKSTDGGQTWSCKDLAASGSTYGQASCLAISKPNPNIVYVGGYYNNSSGWHSALYKSEDGGGNYSSKTKGIQYDPYSIVCHPTDPNKVYVATYWYIYRSTNGGNNWQKNSGAAYGYALAIDSSNPNVLYAGYDKAIFKSNDGGFNWIEHKKGLYGTCNRLLVNSSKVYFGSTAGIFRSTNSGVVWTSVNTGIKSPDVPAIAVAPSSPNTIYAEARANGFFKSTNSGSSWRRMPYFERCDAVLRIAVKSTDAKSVYILAGG